MIIVTLHRFMTDTIPAEGMMMEMMCMRSRLSRV